ncbi:hypothetical protein ABIB37_000733 [Agrococcus sp. UYP10]|uniref:hypothetical protein n=1 Tax=Agrococcus sp. UYP10 TaxID=1756355 RepID=UPI0033910180
MRRIHWTWPAAALCLVGAVVTGCMLLQPPAPRATVTDASGQEVTLSWADFPGEAWVEPAEVLAAPRAEEIESVGDALLTDLQRVVDEHARGGSWAEGAAGGMFANTGNGYGGETLHHLYNSSDRSTVTVPDDWPALSAALDAELAEHGFDPIVWDFDRAPYAHQTPAEHDAEVVEVHGSLDPAQMWQWLGMASNGSAWVSVMLVDLDRGVGAPPETDAAVQSQVSLMAGATVIQAADEQAYRDGTAPFAGLERPEPTTSD